MKTLDYVSDLAGVVVSSYGPVLILALLAWALGRRLTWRVAYRTRLEAILLSITCGLGALASGLFLLAAVGQFRRVPVVLFLVVTQAASWKVWRGLPTALRSLLETRRPALEMMVVGLLGVVVAPLVVLPLYPPTEFDATMFHLPFAQSVLDSDRVAFFSELRYPVTPALQHMLYALALGVTRNDLVPAVVHMLAFVLTALLLYVWGRDLSSARAGLWAGLLWLGTPTAVWAGTAAYVDCTLALFVLSSLFCLTRYVSTREVAWLLLSGGSAAFAAATKYHGLFFVVACLVAGSVAALWFRRPKQIAIAFFVVAVSMLPWYAYITYFTGNPVYPFAPQVFGWSPWAMELMFRRSDEPPPGLDGDEGVEAVVGKLAANIERVDNWRALMIPVNVSLYPERFRGRPPSPLYALAPFLIAGLAVRYRHALFLGGLLVVYGFLWTHSATDLRYLLPVMPVAALLASEALDRLLRWRPWGVPKWVGVLIGALVTLVLMGSAAATSSRIALDRGRLPTDPAERFRFVQRHRPTMRIIEEANRRTPPGSRVYGLLCEDMRHYSRRPLVGDWIGPRRYAKILPYLKDAAELHRRLDRNRIEYLILPDTSKIRSGRLSHIQVPPASALESHFELVFEYRFGSLYRLRDAEEIEVRSELDS